MCVYIRLYTGRDMLLQSLGASLALSLHAAAGLASNILRRATFPAHRGMQRDRGCVRFGVLEIEKPIGLGVRAMFQT